jgi:4-amino-4-deoxychorismate lyase
MPALLVNGVECTDPAQSISASDRGLNYGDGLFETMLLKQGTVRLLDAHLARLTLGCRRLGIPCPDLTVLREDIERVCAGAASGVVKVVVTRGVSGRGYRPSADVAVTRIVALHEPVAVTNTTIRARWCEMRLSRNAALAGIKHLNRLEQVLAQLEWNDPAIEEGFMLDSEGELFCATASNVFIVRGNELATADLRYCGIRGVLRDEVLRLATKLRISVHEEPLWPEDLETASEVFVTNSVRGVRSVIALEDQSWPRGHVAQALQEAMDADA